MMINPAEAVFDKKKYVSVLAALRVNFTSRDDVIAPKPGYVPNNEDIQNLDYLVETGYFMYGVNEV